MKNKPYTAGWKLMGVGGSLILCSCGRASLEKCSNGAGESILDNLQLNNNLAHSNFRYFTFTGKISKYNQTWKNVTLPENMFIFYPVCTILTFSGLRGTRWIPCTGTTPSPVKETPYHLRPRAHNRSLPATDNIMRKNFVMRMLYKDSFWFTCYYLF